MCSSDLEKVSKVASLCKNVVSEDDDCTYVVSCITREHAQTRKKYSGEFDSLREAAKVCAQAYNAGVDVALSCDGKDLLKVYTKTKEVEDFTDDGIASKAFRDAMLWAQKPKRKEKATTEEDGIDIPPETLPQEIDMQDDPELQGLADAQDIGDDG